MAQYKKKPKERNTVINPSIQKAARASTTPKKNDNKPNHTQSMEQKRAVFALEKVSAVVADKDTAKRFKAYANSLPAMIQTSGLGQSLAFAKAKGNSKGPEAMAWLAIYKALDIWLQQQHIWPDFKGDSDVLALLVQGDQMQYRRAQAEAQALLVWLKQFARAEIAGEE
jgi:CRISPR-associated protein Cmr5